MTKLGMYCKLKLGWQSKNYLHFILNISLHHKPVFGFVNQLVGIP